MPWHFPLKVVPVNLLTLIAIAHALKRCYNAARDWWMQRVIARFSSQAMVVTRSAAKQQQHTQEGLQQAIQRLKDLPQVQHEPVSSKFAAGWSTQAYCKYRRSSLILIPSLLLGRQPWWLPPSCVSHLLPWMSLQCWCLCSKMHREC